MTYSAPTIEKSLLSAVMVTYHPDSDIRSRIVSVAHVVPTLFIVDNTPPESQDHELVEFVEGISNVQILPTSGNVGLACAYQIGFSAAEAIGSTWVLTLDQDTALHEGFVDVIRRRLDTVGYLDQNGRSVGVVGANFVNSAVSMVHVREGHGGVITVDAVISSGSLTSIDCWRTIGGFREDFFIDYVDIEFCLRARKAEVGVVLVTDVLMTHGMGNTAENTLVCGYRRFSSNYPPLRHYYIARNFVATALAHGRSDGRWLKAEVARRCRFTCLSLLMESGRFTLAVATVRGVFDGLRRRMGPTY